MKRGWRGEERRGEERRGEEVRQPVICPNCHVFCASCMDTWTQKVSQCPACRVPITPDNPCRRLIETSRRLRKTRGVLLLREYEEEIDRLLQENGELKARIQGPGGEGEGRRRRRTSELGELQQLSQRLKSATDVCAKVKDDMERLKQANKLLRSQNVDLVQENMNLRAEVASRSPQKFSRYTVAALEATNQQNEWKLKQLTKALEQSDKTIERLQAHLRGYEGSPPGLWGATGDPVEEKNLVMMRRSLSDTERQSICSNPEDQTMSLEGQSSIFTASSGRSEGEKVTGFTATTFYGTPPKLKASTPSSAFCSLSLKSPALGGGKVAIKAGTSLRKLSFEDPPEMVSSTVSQTENRSPNLPKCLAASTKAETSKAPFWGAWQEPKSKTPPSVGPSIEDSQTVGDASSASATLVKPSGSHTSSEASMDAAYRNKVSELDCMMWDSDSSCSLGSRISPAADLDATLVPKPKPAAAPAVSSSASKEEHGSVLSLQQAQPSCDPSPNAPDTRCKVSSSSSSTSGWDRQLLSVGQSAKRKSHSPFNAKSPTKLSKFV
ncbi:hypothetical protein CRUP_001045 [Coryphaenoides rupestris]|nr:hypothetical protein CRUP_001045 [Coryphaenoides rupestris]